MYLQLSCQYIFVLNLHVKYLAAFLSDLSGTNIYKHKINCKSKKCIVSIRNEVQSCMYYFFIQAKFTGVQLDLALISVHFSKEIN